MSESHHPARQLIISILIAAVIAYGAFYVFTKIKPVPPERQEEKIERETVVSQDVALPETVAETQDMPAISYPKEMTVYVYLCAKTDVVDERVEELSLEDARLALLSKRCADGYEEYYPSWTFNVTRGKAESTQSEQMQQIASQLEGTNVYTCIDIRGNMDGSKEKQHIAIPGLSDNPAAKGNLQTPDTKSLGRCKEGFTEHPGVLTALVPEGYYIVNQPAQRPEKASEE